MATIRKYYFETTFGVVSCSIFHDSRPVAEFRYFLPEKLLQIPRYEFSNFGIQTLGEYNYELFLFIKRISKFVADGSMKEFRNKVGQQVEFDFPSEDGLFESDIYPR